MGLRRREQVPEHTGANASYSTLITFSFADRLCVVQGLGAKSSFPMAGQVPDHPVA